MWVIIKFDKNNFEFLKEELRKKLGDNFIIYNPNLDLNALWFCFTSAAVSALLYII